MDARRPKMDRGPESWGRLGGGAMISLVLHGLVAAFLLVRFDWHLPDMRQEQQTVDVVLVPEPQPEPEEEAVPPEPEPEPEPQPQEEAAPPEPEPAPQAEEVQEPEAQQAEAAQPLPVLQPVYEYADKDNGSEQAQEGAEEADKQEAEAAQEPDQQAEPEGEETAEAEQHETPDVTEPVAETETETETSATENVPQTAEEVPVAGEAEPGPEASSEAEAIPAGPELSEVAPSDFGTVGPIASLSAPPPKPSKPASAPKGLPNGTSGNLIKARTIYSDALSDDPRAWTAMAGMNRDERANMLCMTELRDQLHRASPPWRPEALPILHLGSGTVLQNDKAAFLSAGQWYDLAVRCEVNSRVTRVIDFGYRVGAPVPRSQWRQRKFPEL